VVYVYRLLQHPAYVYLAAKIEKTVRDTADGMKEQKLYMQEE